MSHSTIQQLAQLEEHRSTDGSSEDTFHIARTMFKIRDGFRATGEDPDSNRVMTVTDLITKGLIFLAPIFLRAVSEV